MNIVGLDALVFGVDDVADCARYLIDYGLTPVDTGPDGGRFEGLDGTAILLARRDDPSLPPPLPTASTLRKTIYGVADAATLDAIAAELGRDRAVRWLADGSLESVDDLGFALGFRVSTPRPLTFAAEAANAPGVSAQRPVNALGVDTNAPPPKPRSLSHVVYFVPDVAKAEAFYADRLGFVTTDRFTKVGPFMRPAGCRDHHTLFMIQTPPFLQGCEHFTFHMGGPTEVLAAGRRMVELGYQSFWGPGRHIFGSNWFWYFNSPFGCHVEYDADMDHHDADWVAREAEANADSSQVFLFQARELWFPSGPPPAKTA